MHSSIKFACIRIMTFIGVLAHNTGINKAKKTSFLIHITGPIFLDVDIKKLLYYLQSLTVVYLK